MIKHYRMTVINRRVGAVGPSPGSKAFTVGLMARFTSVGKQCASVKRLKHKRKATRPRLRAVAVRVACEIQ